MFDEYLGAGMTPALAMGAIGGLLLNVVNLYQDSQRPKSSRTIKDVLYWCLFVTWPLVAAVLVYAYRCSGYDVRGILALTTGITAPSIIQTLAQKVGETHSPKGAEP